MSDEAKRLVEDLNYSAFDLGGEMEAIGPSVDPEWIAERDKARAALLAYIERIERERDETIHLRAEGKYAVVAIRVGGVWSDVIREHLDSPFSHFYKVKP